MNHEPNLLPEQCQPEELIVFLGLRPRYLNDRENGDLWYRYLQVFCNSSFVNPILNLSEWPAIAMPYPIFQLTKAYTKLTGEFSTYQLLVAVPREESR